MLASLFAAIQSLPMLLKGIQDLVGYFQKMEEAGFFKARVEAMQAIESAETEEEYKNAAKLLQDALRRL